MKKTRVSVLAFVMAILLVITSLSAGTAGAMESDFVDLPVVRQTPDGIVLEGNSEGELWVTDYLGTADEVLIPSTVDDMPVTKIDMYAFYDADSVRKVTISEGVTIIDKYAFDGCKNLCEVNLPDSLEVIEKESFTNCWNLTTFNIPKNVFHVGVYAFFGSGIENINVDPENKHFSSIDGVMFDKNFSTLVEYPSCKEGEEYVVPETVKQIGATSFFKNQNLKKITLPEGLDAIGYYAFFGCDSLEQINLPDSLTVIASGAFNYCEEVKEFSIGKSLWCLEPEVFYSCAALTAINVDPENTTFSSKDGVLFDKAGETLLLYPQKKADINYVVPDGTKEIGTYAFHCARGIYTITFPDSLETIRSSAFSNAQGLKTINFGKGLTTLESACFFACFNLEDVNLPDTISVIPSSAFSSCYNLEEIEIPEGVTEIGGEAFSNCAALRKIIIPYTVESIGESTFSQYPPMNVTIYGYLNSYAEQYARENNIAFMPIGTTPVNPTTPDETPDEFPGDAGAQKALLGDVTLDGRVDIRDATAIQKHLAAIAEFAVDSYKVADANGDKAINIKDATELQKHLANLPANKEIGKTVISEETYTVYLKNSADWPNVHIYWWNDELEYAGTMWPGIAMNNMGDGIYCAEIPAIATHVIFSCSGEEPYSSNICLEDHKSLYFDNKWDIWY